jgi:hypothetical protein
LKIVTANVCNTFIGPVTAEQLFAKPEETRVRQRIVLKDNSLFAVREHRIEGICLSPPTAMIGI